MRPKKLAGDHSNYNQVLLHAITELRKLGYEFDILVNRDCTVPFIKNSDMENSIKMLEKKNSDLVCGVYKNHHNPYFNMMEVDSNGFLKFSKKMKNRELGRQKSPIVYQLNGLFVINVKRLLKIGKWNMPKILPYEILPETGFMIDNEFEFQIAELIAKKKIKI